MWITLFSITAAIAIAASAAAIIMETRTRKTRVLRIRL